MRSRAATAESLVRPPRNAVARVRWVIIIEIFFSLFSSARPRPWPLLQHQNYFLDRLKIVSNHPNYCLIGHKKLLPTDFV